MKALREARRKRGLSQQELSRTTGIAQNSISEIELGHREPRGSTLRKLAKALDVEIADLLREPAHPKVDPPRDRPVEPGAGASLLGERRLLSALHPFTRQVEDRTAYWRRLAKSGQVNASTLEYASAELGFTARGFEALVDAVIVEGRPGSELRLLRRVYQSIAGPYREAWNALMQAWVASAAEPQGSKRRLRLVADADAAMRVVERAGEALRRAA